MFPTEHSRPPGHSAVEFPAAWALLERAEGDEEGLSANGLWRVH